jgi:hypothetical protein
MKRYSLLAIPLVLLGALAVALSAPAPNPEPKKPNPLPGKLTATVKFPGLPDPKMTLTEALDFLSQTYDVPFEINDAAFKADNLDDPGSAPLGKPVPKMLNVSLDRVLRTVLSRVGGNSGAAYLIRPEAVEITTTAYLRTEIWGDEYKGPYLPLVNRALDKKPLADALKELSDVTGFNVVLDARVADKAKVPVSASFRNLPLDTAVRVLADMAELHTSLNDNVVYVTTEARAGKLRPASDNDQPMPAVGFTGPLPPGLLRTPSQPGLGGTLSQTKRVNFDKRPLGEALQELLETTGCKLVLDPRTGDKVKTPVTANLEGVSIETSLRVLADMADLKPVFMENVVYVTSKENARTLQAEQDARDAEKLKNLLPGLPGTGSTPITK